MKDEQGEEDNASGFRPSPAPEPGSSPQQVFDSELRHYADDFLRQRRLVKRRATASTVFTAAMTGVTGFLSVLASFGGWLWPTLAIAGVSALTMTTLAWERHFDHRGLWVSRTHTLAELQSLRRRWHMKLSSSDWLLSTEDIAPFAEELDTILMGSAEQWRNGRDRDPGETTMGPT